MRSTLLGTFLVWAFAAASAPATGWAGPFLREQVPADAKWVAHLDLDAFRSSQVGDALIKARIDQEMARVRADLQAQWDLEFDWRQIHSLTAYGVEFRPAGKAHGVLLVVTSWDVQRGLDAAIAKQVDAGGEGTIKRVEEGPIPVYSVRGEFFVALPGGKPVVMARSRDQLDRGVAVLAGQAHTLAGTSAFLDFPPLPQSYAFLAMAAGFAEQTSIPPRARVLKMADAVQLVVGETGNQVFLNAALKAKTAEAGIQMQQVIQGLLAFSALGQPENRDWQRVLQSAKVSAQDGMVTVGLQAPSLGVIERLGQRRTPSPGP